MLNFNAKKHAFYGKRIFKKTNPKFESPGVAEPGQHPKTRPELVKYIYSIAFKKRSPRLVKVLKEFEVNFEHTSYQTIDNPVASLAKKIGPKKARVRVIQELEFALKNLENSSASFKLINLQAEKLNKTSSNEVAKLRIIRSGLSNTQMGIGNYIQIALDHLKTQ